MHGSDARGQCLGSDEPSGFCQDLFNGKTVLDVGSGPVRREDKQYCTAAVGHQHRIRF